MVCANSAKLMGKNTATQTMFVFLFENFFHVSGFVFDASKEIFSTKIQQKFVFVLKLLRNYVFLLQRVSWTVKNNLQY